MFPRAEVFRARPSVRGSGRKLTLTACLRLGIDPQEGSRKTRRLEPWFASERGYEGGNQLHELQKSRPEE